MSLVVNSDICEFLSDTFFLTLTHFFHTPLSPFVMYILLTSRSPRNILFLAKYLISLLIDKAQRPSCLKVLEFQLLTA